MSAVVCRLLEDESGQGMVEYALVIAFIAFAVYSALSAMGGGVKAFFNDFATKLAEISP